MAYESKLNATRDSAESSRTLNGTALSQGERSLGQRGVKTFKRKPFNLQYSLLIFFLITILTVRVHGHWAASIYLGQLIFEIKK